MGNVFNPVDISATAIAAYLVAPGPIGGTTPNTGQFTTLTATVAVRATDVGTGSGTALSLTTTGGTQAQITNSAAANRNITLTGSNGSTTTIGSTAGLIDIKPAGANVGVRIDSGAIIVGPTIAVPAGGVTAITIGSSGPVIAVGSGAPSLSAAKGSIYLNSTGSGIADRLYVNTSGSTTWTNFVSAA